MKNGSLPSVRSKRTRRGQGSQMRRKIAWLEKKRNLVWPIPEPSNIDDGSDTEETKLVHGKSEAKSESERVSGTGGTAEAEARTQPDNFLVPEGIEKLDKAASAAFLAHNQLKTCFDLSWLQTDTMIEALQIVEDCSKGMALVALKLRNEYEHGQGLHVYRGRESFADMKHAAPVGSRAFCMSKMPQKRQRAI